MRSRRTPTLLVLLPLGNLAQSLPIGLLFVAAQNAHQALLHRHHPWLPLLSHYGSQWPVLTLNVEGQARIEVPHRTWAQHGIPNQRAHGDSIPGASGGAVFPLLLRGICRVVLLAPDRVLVPFVYPEHGNRKYSPPLL